MTYPYQQPHQRPMHHPQYRSVPPHPGAAIAVTAKFSPFFFPAAFILALMRPRMWLDHGPGILPWGRTMIPVPPGRHHLRVFLRYPMVAPGWLFAEVSVASILLTVYPGQTLEVEYRTSHVLFGAGSLGQPPQRHGALFVMLGLWLLVLGLCALGIATA